MRILAAGVLVLGACFASGTANAYCRATTSQVPAGYDPVANGCWNQGTPLAWRSTRIPYGVSSTASKQVDYASAARTADLAFHAWDAVLCTGAPVGFETYDDGPVSAVEEASDCTTSSACNPEEHDVIEFDDDDWPHDDPENTLALTTVTYGVDDGHIFEAYTEVNTAQHLITTEEPPPSGGAYDLQAILTHEAGHFLGLAHASETAAIMYAFYQPGAITLRSDDVQGICTIYPPPQTTGGGSCAMTGGERRAPCEFPVAALAIGLVASRIRRKKKRMRSVR